MKYLLNIYDQGETYNLEFNTFNQLKNHLIKYTNLYFGWINNTKMKTLKLIYLTLTVITLPQLKKLTTFRKI